MIRQRLGKDWLKSEVFTDTDEDNSLSALWDTEPRSIEELSLDAIATGFEGCEDLNKKSFRDSLHKPADIFRDEYLRPDAFDESGEFKEEVICPLNCIRLLLGLAPIFVAVAGSTE